MCDLSWDDLGLGLRVIAKGLGTSKPKGPSTNNSVVGIYYYRKVSGGFGEHFSIEQLDPRGRSGQLART